MDAWKSLMMEVNESLSVFSVLGGRPWSVLVKGSSMMLRLMLKLSD